MLLASSYLQTLCKHFSHKVKVEFDEQRGWAGMPHGSLRMQPDGSLHFEIEAAGRCLARVPQGVIDAHIVRLALREKLQRLNWR